jgi:uncharacterized BrkB/YihY/UPF0761 family membrane protein
MKAVSWSQALKRLPMGIYEHGALGYAKGASYSALLSFFPVFAVTTAALFAADAPEVARRVANLLYSVSPPEVEQLLQAWFTEHITHPQSLRVAAVLLSLWAASGVVSTLMQAFQAAYEKRDTRRPSVRNPNRISADEHAPGGGSDGPDPARRLGGNQPAPITGRPGSG